MHVLLVKQLFQKWVLHVKIQDITFVAVGIHHLDLERGRRDLSAGGNCLIVTNCRMFLKEKIFFNTDAFFRLQSDSSLKLIVIRCIRKKKKHFHSRFFYFCTEGYLFLGVA